MGTTRFVYNKGLHAIKTEEHTTFNFQNLRNRFVTHKRRNGEINQEVSDWELETPKDIRAEGLRDLVKAYSTAITNLKRGNIDRFTMRYRSKKHYQSIVIPKSALKIENKKLYMYKTFMNNNGLRMSKNGYSMIFEHDCRLQYKHGDWYLIVPIKIQTNMNSTKNNGIASLDPGVRTFQTIYSENHVVKIQQNNDVLNKLHEKLSLFQSLRASKRISRSHYKRRIQRIYKRLDNLIDELHFQTINYLSKHYELVLLPVFESQDMVKRRLSRKCNRNMLQLKHYQFKERLKEKCRMTKSCRLEIVTEEYTSKTCGSCGFLKENLNSNRTFNCNNCNLTIDRDINGARNILLKYCC